MIIEYCAIKHTMPITIERIQELKTYCFGRILIFNDNSSFLLITITVSRMLVLQCWSGLIIKPYFLSKKDLGHKTQIF